MRLKIGNFIEKYNTFIQIILFIAILIVGIILPLFNIIDKNSLIISLLSLISFEMLFLIFHNNQFQDKIYSLFFNKLKKSNIVCIDANDGYEKFSLLLSQANKDLFISGITCNSIWRYVADIKKLLENNTHIRILISSEKSIESNVLICTGVDFDVKTKEALMKNVYSKLNCFSEYILTDAFLKEKFLTNMFEIRTTNIPFTIACVGTNIFNNNNNTQLKISQYIPGREMNKCPNMFINPNSNNELYNYYLNVLKELWDKACPLDI